MRVSVLCQQIILDSGSKEFLYLLELFVMSYAKIFALLFVMLLLVAALLTIVERHERRAKGVLLSAAQRPQPLHSGRRLGGYDLRLSRPDSLS